MSDNEIVAVVGLYFFVALGIALPLFAFAVGAKHKCGLRGEGICFGLVTIQAAHLALFWPITAIPVLIWSKRKVSK